MKSIFFYIILAFTLLNCSNSDQSQNAIKDALIKKMLQNTSLDQLKNQQGRLIILKNKYCENLDCENYFKGYEDEVLFYGKEDLFMRGMRNYVEITDINERQKYIDLTKVIKREEKNIHIQL